MGLRKNAPVAVVETPAIETPRAQYIPANDPPVAAPQYTAEEKRVRGQVRTHVIKSARNSSALLAPTLSNTASGIEETWHRLTLEAAERDLKWVMEE